MKSKATESYLDSPQRHKTIKEWREDEKPREKLIAKGTCSLSDAELLTIIISEGTKNLTAFDIAIELLERHKNLNRIAKCDISELKQVKGIGDAKAVTLTAAFELAKRLEIEPFPLLNSNFTPESIANHYIPKFKLLEKEVFVVLLLNSSNKIFREVTVTQGILNASLVHPREVFRLAITENAASIIILHNHPSGNANPSSSDIEITKQLIKAGEYIDIKVLDHIIIAGVNYCSFFAKGLI